MLLEALLARSLIETTGKALCRSIHCRYVEEPDIDAWRWVEGPKQPTYRVTFYQKDLWYALLLLAQLISALAVHAGQSTLSPGCGLQWLSPWRCPALLLGI